MTAQFILRVLFFESDPVPWAAVTLQARRPDSPAVTLRLFDGSNAEAAAEKYAAEVAAVINAEPKANVLIRRGLAESRTGRVQYRGVPDHQKGA